MFGHHFCFSYVLLFFVVGHSLFLHIFFFFGLHEIVQFDFCGSEHKFKCIACFYYLLRLELVGICVFGECILFSMKDIGFTGVHKKNHTDRSNKNRHASSQVTRKQTLFYSSSISCAFVRLKASPKPIAFYIIRHTFSSTRQIK